MKPRLLLLICLFAVFPLYSQPYSEGRHTRHRFAQLTLGAELAYYPALGGTQYLDTDGQLQAGDLPTLISPRLSIGGLHFWGHADFSVVFPVSGIRLNKPETPRSIYDPGVETIAKWYPWAVKRKAIRPYLGFAAQPFSFRQNAGPTSATVGPWTSRITTPLMAGFTLMTGSHLLEVGAKYHALQQTLAYPVSTTEMGEVSLPPLTFTVGYKFMLETTVGEERRWESGRTQEVTDELGSRLNGWFLGVGPSSAWMVGPSPALFGFPSVKTPLASGVFADVVGGYYWHKPDMNLNLAYRRVKVGSSGYEREHSQVRQSIGLECTKYLADYHGFVSFVGPIVSMEFLRTSFNTPQDQTWETTKPALGITAGWDIRPSRLQWFYLRTNLRWYPRLGMETGDTNSVRFQNLEVNFIQFVWMIGRER